MERRSLSDGINLFTSNIELDIEAGVLNVALCQEEAVSGFSYMQCLEIGRRVYTIDAPAGTAIGGFDDERIVFQGHLYEQVRMGHKVGRRNRQATAMGKGSGNGFVAHAANRPRVIDGWDARRFRRFQNTEARAI